MVKNLILEKKNIISYIIAIMISLTSVISGFSPLLISIICAIIDLKIPVLIPFLFMVFVTGLKYGTVVLTKFTLTIFVYVIIKSFFSNKQVEPTRMGNLLKLIISTAFVDIFFLIAEIIKFEDFSQLLFANLLSFAFYIVFSYSLPIIVDFNKDMVFTKEEALSVASTIIFVFAGCSFISLFGINLATLAIVICLMLNTWKRTSLEAFVYSLIIVIVTGLISNITIQSALLLIICGIITSLLSRVRKKRCNNWSGVCDYSVHNSNYNNKYK